MDGDSEGDAWLEIVGDAFARALRRRTLSPAQRIFIEQVLADFRVEELPSVDAEALTAILADFWRFAEGSSLAEPQIRLLAPKAREGSFKLDLLQIVQEDRPFVVDSVMGELAAAGLDVRAMFHPVIRSAAAVVSMILVCSPR